MNFNKKHPELEEGEIFLMNISPEESLQDGMTAPFLESRRLGEVAYDTNGNVVEGWKPMFGKLLEEDEKSKV